MKFEEIEIFGFGRLKNNLKIPFGRRINIILAPNDKGKSTLQEAIFAIFYPFGDVKSEEGRKKRTRFKPWKSEKYGGALIFRLNNGEKFKIEKLINSTPREDKIGVFKISNGNWIPIKVLRQDRYLGLLTGKHFLGIGRDVFEGLSIVRQFDVASLGERRKILDEIRSIIETGKSGEGLAQALKKLQERKNLIGTTEKKGKKTLAGSRQIRLEELEAEIKHLREQLTKSRSLLVEKKKNEALLEEKIIKLEQELTPALEELKEEISFQMAIVEKEYYNTPTMIREMGLQELQNLRSYKDSLAQLKIRLESREENIKKIKKSLKNNWILTGIFAFFSIIFLFLSMALDFREARFIFLAFALLLLSGSIYFFKVIKTDKKFIAQAQKEEEKLLKSFSQQGRELGILENSEGDKGVQFYEELWNLFLNELGVSNWEELETRWHRTKRLTLLINKVKKLEFKLPQSSEVFEVNLDELDSRIEKFNDLISQHQKLQEEIERLKENIQIFEKSIDNILPQNEMAILYTEKLILEKELETIGKYREALELSIEFLKQAGEKLYEEVSPYINEFVNKYFKYLSSDYEFVQVTPDLQLYLKPRYYPEVIGVENIGKGMQTGLYLFLRLGLISLFVTNKNESLPFILDETFNVLDDFSENRQRKFLELLLEVSSDYDIQCIYFTCQKNGQYIPIKTFLEEKGYTIREESAGDFMILHGGRNESEIGG